MRQDAIKCRRCVRQGSAGRLDGQRVQHTRPAESVSHTGSTASVRHAEATRSARQPKEPSQTSWKAQVKGEAATVAACAAWCATSAAGHTFKEGHTALTGTWAMPATNVQPCTHPTWVSAATCTHVLLSSHVVALQGPRINVVAPDRIKPAHACPPATLSSWKARRRRCRRRLMTPAIMRAVARSSSTATTAQKAIEAMLLAAGNVQAVHLSGRSQREHHRAAV